MVAMSIFFIGIIGSNARFASRPPAESAIRYGIRVAACVIAGPFLAHLLYGVSPRDPLAITAGPAVLIGVAALAISRPARRAMQQDPIIALRAE